MIFALAANGGSPPFVYTDAEAQDFTDTSDLSEYDLSGFKPVSFQMKKKDARLEMRISQVGLDTLKAEAQRRGVPHCALPEPSLSRA
jgi:predicted DNA binding CopG/RHH family protein